MDGKKGYNNMKTTSYAFGIIAVFIGLNALSTAEEIARTTSTTIAGGTITEFAPSESVVIQSDASPSPMRYFVTRDTTWVDEAGTPVTAERIQRGLPVTVRYVREGDRMLASRVIVHREARMSKARAKALKEYYDKLADKSEGREKANAEALEEYYDKLADELKD
jgi:hypothetical protein